MLAHTVFGERMKAKMTVSGTVTFGNLSEGRNNNFDFIRFLLASFVVFTHSYSILTTIADEPIEKITNNQIALATIAVNMFFVLSGYFITASWDRTRNYRDYLLKRFFRIYPGFIAAVVITVPVAVMMGSRDPLTVFQQLRTYTYIPRELLFRDPILYGTFQNSRTPELPLGSLATLPHEVSYYLFLPCLAALGLLRRREACTVLTGISLAYFVLSSNYRWAYGGPYWPRLTPCFLTGVTFYLYRRQIPHSRLWLAISSVVLVLSCRYGLNYLLPLFGGYILFYAGFARVPALQRFGKYGDPSYGIFLYGYLVQQIITEHFGPRLNPTTLTLFSLPVTYAIAYGSWHLIEKRFVKHGKPSRKAAELA